MEHPVSRAVMLSCIAVLAFFAVSWVFCATLNSILQMDVCYWLLDVVESGREYVARLFARWLTGAFGGPRGPLP